MASSNITLSFGNTQMGNNNHVIQGIVYNIAQASIFRDPDERLTILKWLSPLDYSTYHNSYFNRVLVGTGQWLLHDKRYLDWKTSTSSSILWLHGSIGTGKSCLTSIVINELLSEATLMGTPRPCYFNCLRSTSEPLRSDPTAILASIARQMSCVSDSEAILTPAADLYKQAKEHSIRSPSLKHSTELMVRLAKIRGVTHIVIDALDETNSLSRRDLLNSLKECMKSTEGIVRLYVSTRNDEDIKVDFAGHPRVMIEPALNSTDITLFIDTEIKTLGKTILYGKADDDLMKLIRQALIEGANGMFQWVNLQLQFICSLRSRTAIIKRLGKLPTDLEQIYEELYSFNMAQMMEEDRVVAETAFRWILYAKTSLSTTQFRSAVCWTTQEDMEDVSMERLLQNTFNFVIHDKTSDAFRFPHLSVREYLEKRLEFQSSVSEAMAAVACLKSLEVLQAVSGELRRLDDWAAKQRQRGAFIDVIPPAELHNALDVLEEAIEGTFVGYAVAQWSTHCMFVKERSLQCNVFAQLCDTFLSSRGLQTFNRWLLAVKLAHASHLYLPHLPYSDQFIHDIGSFDITQLGLRVSIPAEDLALPSSLSSVSREWDDLTLAQHRNGPGNEALSKLIMDDCRVSSTLLGMPTEKSLMHLCHLVPHPALWDFMNSSDLKTYSQFPYTTKDHNLRISFVTEAEDDQAKTVRVVLHNNLHTSNGQEIATTYTHNSTGGRAAAICVAKYLPLGTDLNLSLCDAVKKNDLDCAQALLANGADANAGCEGTKALVHALRCGFRAMSDMLLVYGADPNVAQGIGVDRDAALFTAVINNDFIVVKRLLAAGADADTVVKRLLAADKGVMKFESAFEDDKDARFAIMDALLMHGAKPDAGCAGRAGPKIFDYAICHGHLALVKYLLTSESGYNLRPVFDRVVSRDDRAAFEFLLGDGIDLNTSYVVDSDAAVSTFVYAVKHMCTDIVEYLLVHEADVKASWQRSKALDRVDPSIATIASSSHLANTRYENEAVLYHAVKNRSSKMVRILLAHGADFGTSFETSPEMRFAVQEYDEATVRVLLDHGSAYGSKCSDTGRQEAFLNAAYHSSYLLVEHFLLDGIDVNTTCDGWTALTKALNGRAEKDVIRKLVEHGADLNHVTERGTAMHIFHATYVYWGWANDLYEMLIAHNATDVAGPNCKCRRCSGDRL